MWILTCPTGDARKRSIGALWHQVYRDFISAGQSSGDKRQGKVSNNWEKIVSNTFLPTSYEVLAYIVVALTLVYQEKETG